MAAKEPLAKDSDDFEFTGTPMNEALVRDRTGGGFVATPRDAGFGGWPGHRQQPPGAIAVAPTSTRSVAGGRFFTVVDPVSRRKAKAPAGRQDPLTDFAMRLDFLVLEELGYRCFVQAGVRFSVIARLRAKD